MIFPAPPAQPHNHTQPRQQSGVWSSPVASSSVSEKLYVRLQQPVEGCELEPFATVVNRTAVGGGAQEGNAGLTFLWSCTASPTFSCAFSRCKLNEAAMVAPSSDAAGRGAAAGRGGGRGGRGGEGGGGAGGGGGGGGGGAPAAPSLQCLMCLRAGSVTTVQSVFCSQACLVKGWKEHARYHERQEALLAARGGGAGGAGAAAAAAAAAAEEGALAEGAGAAAAVAAAADVAALLAAPPDPLDKDATLFLKPLALSGLDLKALPGGGGGVGRGGAGGGGARAAGGAGARAPATPPPPRVSVGASALAPPGPEEWRNVSRERVFHPGPLDIGHRLRLEVTARAGPGQGPERVITQTAETQPVLPQPPPASSRRFVLAPDVAPERPLGKEKMEAWVQTARREGLRAYVGGAALRVFCWNILAEIYASSAQYPYVPLWQLPLSYRGGVVLRELLGSDADLLALQEVQVRPPAPPLHTHTRTRAHLLTRAPPSPPSPPPSVGLLRDAAQARHGGRGLRLHLQDQDARGDGHHREDGRLRHFLAQLAHQNDPHVEPGAQ
jgi:hypothetical protein